jgi:prepilin-type N-terminal cleavage/methylation domain-containing protein
MTLPEVMVASAILAVVMAGVVVIHLSGLRLNGWARSKMGASDEAREAISLMATEIRGAGAVRIGTGGLESFAEVGHGELQRGNAIEIYPVKGRTNEWIRYFWDAGDQRLKRTVSGLGAELVVANSISNSMVFTSEDFAGRILSNNFNNRVIGVHLQFFQLQSPSVEIGPGGLYDFYQLRTKITRRALE